MDIILELLFGLGIFLYGMSQLETGAKDLSGHRLRTWLLRSTKSPISSAASGTVITALLQSSSIVGLIVLAFASAGVIPLYNAIGVLLGANLGTTLTGWLVALLGFKLDLNHLALPFIALGGLSQVVLSKSITSRAAGQIVLGLGLVLFGLGLMKESVIGLPELIPLASLQGHHSTIYLLFGVLLTAVIQSSSASMMIALAALNAGLIQLPDAAALIIGADFGTTSTIILGSLAGNTIKRQLAFSHCFFNLVVDLFAFAVLLPLLPRLQSFFGMSDPLYSLVAFHSTFNLVGLLAFAPFLKQLTHWIETIFKHEKPELCLLKIPTRVPEAALPALKETIKQLWIKIIVANMSYFDLRLNSMNFNEKERDQLQLLQPAGSNNNHEVGDEENYESIKAQEGDIVQFTIMLQQQALTKTQTQCIIDCLETTRSIVYSCKTLKDIAHNLKRLQHTKDKMDEMRFKQLQQYQSDFYHTLIHLLLGTHDQGYLLETFQQLRSDNDNHHTEMDKQVYESTPSQLPYSKEHGGNTVIGTHISSLLNVNHEIHHANKNILLGLRRWTTITEVISE